MADMSNLGWLMAASSIIQALGMNEQGRAARMQGERQRQVAEFNALQAERQAGNVIAISQREAQEKLRLSRLMASRSLAVAAASGGGVTDPTVVHLLSLTRGEGAYQANVALYEGEAKARQLRLDAAASRVYGADAYQAGVSAERGARFAGLGALAKGGASLFAKYGMNGPGAGSGDAGLILDAGSPSFLNVG